MTFDNQYDYFTGTVTVDADAPEEWMELPVLPFWERPNDPAWGNVLCRVLYHEAIHFWQFLSSRYVAALVSQQWERLGHFEQTGVLAPEGSILNGFARHSEPFSPSELVECWARYWDVHTRNPLRIIDEEGIPGAPPDFRGAYTDKAYDLVMTEGPSCNLYARPYRWLLQEAQGHWLLQDAGARSMLVNLVFPMLTTAAFATLNPVDFLCSSFRRVLASSRLALVVSEWRGESINFSWLKCWDQVVREAVIPSIDEAGDVEALAEIQDSGYGVIRQGPMSAHPVFGPYTRVKGYRSSFFWWFNTFIATYQPPEPPEYPELLRSIARAMPVTAPHAMPGQPQYRLVLGALVPPPRIRFRNFTWYAPAVLEVGLLPNGAVDYRTQNGETLEPAFAGLDHRVRRFRQAEEAVRLGLPADSFGY